MTSGVVRSHVIKSHLLATAGVALALWMSIGSAQAQSATEAGAPAEPDAAEKTNPADIVVTGTRITTSTFNAPTPTTVVSVEQIQQTAAPNIFDGVSQLPAMQGSAGTANRQQNGGTSFGSNGLSSLNLRGLGASRTLTMLDGQRVVPAFISGITDVSQFPQLLIKRVDIVTGGASASWGSDAVAGVVNFITDTKFTGFKANVQGGISTYGDDQSILAQAAFGFKAFDDRLHVQLSGELYDNHGVPGGEVGGKQPNGRPDAYRSGTTSYSLTGTPAGQPQYWAFPYNAQLTTFSRYGLITAGPANLKGLAFDGNGGLTPFVFGTPCIGTTCLGGDQSAYITTTTIDNPLRREVGYGRVGFDITPDIELYGTLMVGRTRTENTPIAYPRKNANLTIKCSNAFLVGTAVPGLCAANTPVTTTFTIGATAMQMPDIERIKTDRRSLRYVVGSAGKFNLGGSDVSFDIYYQHGRNNADIRIHNMTLTPRFNAAMDAVFQSGNSGPIVCNNAAARASGCIPINLFSSQTISPAAFAWIAPANGPYQLNVFEEDVVSAAFNATPFNNWAGPVSVALGAEWRKESYVTRADPYGNGITADTPNNADYPADSLLNTGGTNWFAGNYKNGSGEFSVKEAFLELGVPLTSDSSAIGKIDLNLAGRIEDYSTAGNATTWKVGGTWDTPLEGLRLRGVVSRDVRAPNLSELFAPATSATQNVLNRLVTPNPNVQLINQGIGNPNLKPEIGKTWEVGAIYRPEFIRGLNLSFDYYNIKIDGAIKSLGIQQIVDLCQVQGNTSYCANVKLTGTLGSADFPYVTVQPFNVASERVRGFDIEASYQFQMDGIGKFTLRALATRTLDYVSDFGIAGQQVAQFAGNNSEGGQGVPKWKALFTQSWTNDTVTLTATQRVISAGFIDPNAIVCTSACPATTIQNPTYSFNSIPGAVYVDFGGSYKIAQDKAEIYFKVDNVFNHRAPPFGGSSLYDQVGRMYRMGIRVKI